MSYVLQLRAAAAIFTFLAALVVLTSSATTGQDVDLQTVTNANGFQMFGSTTSAQLGTVVSIAGDVNKDGIDDFLVGTFSTQGVYVIFGNGSRILPNVNFATMVTGPKTGYKITPVGRGYRGGDVNGDGIQDILIATTNYFAVVIYGRDTTATGAVVTDISINNWPTSETNGFRIFGASADNAGSSLACAGDVNGDGADDVVMGASSAKPPNTAGGADRTAAGIVYVIFGQKFGTGVYDVTLTDITGNYFAGFRILGAVTQDRLGMSSGAGDVNADGVQDVIVAANVASRNGLTACGVAYVVFGRRKTLGATSYSDIDLSVAAPSSFFFSITGALASSNTGFALSGAGDLNGDGVADVIIGAYQASFPSRLGAGIVYVIFGRRGVGASTDILLSTIVTGSSLGFRLLGASAFDNAGRSVSAAGDVNGDGIDDAIIGAYGARVTVGTVARSSAGAAYVIFGRNVSSGASAFGDVDLLTIKYGSTAGFRILGGATNDGCGISVSGGGDINHDGISDVIVGSYLADPATLGANSNAGIAYVIYGAISQPTSQPSTQPSAQPSSQPNARPSRQPSSQPSSRPSAQPSSAPSQPSGQPSGQPTTQPSGRPSSQPSTQPTGRPSAQPSCQPTVQPSSQPSGRPSMQPTTQPSTQPTRVPSSQPTGVPSTQPSARPSSQPSSQPSLQPSSQPSAVPTMQPSSQPSSQPSTQPSVVPSSQPTSLPSSQPSSLPSGQPSSMPSARPSSQPSSQPSERPSSQPSGQPSGQPSRKPSSQPSGIPSSVPSAQPTMQPSGQPRSAPSALPSGQPTSQPSGQPSSAPSCQPSSRPTSQPSGRPSSRPSAQLSRCPSSQPSSEPTQTVTILPTVAPSDGWAALVVETARLGQLSVVNGQVWVCGENGNSSTSSCSLLDPLTGKLTMSYRFSVWNRMDAPTMSTITTGGSVVVSGRTGGVDSAASEMGSCAVWDAYLFCDVKSFADARFLAASYVSYPNRIVYVGMYNVYVSATILDVTTDTARSFIYFLFNLKSVMLSQAQSPPNFIGCLVAGTAVRSAGSAVSSIVVGLLRTDNGVLSAMSVLPVTGDILTSVDLVTAATLEITGPDSFIVGGLELSDNFGKHAYLLRANALYSTIQYCVRFRTNDEVNSEHRRLASGAGSSHSIARGVVYVDDSMFVILDHTRNNTTMLSVVKVSANGVLGHQVSIAAPNANIQCTGITSSGTNLIIACNVVHNNATQQAVVLATNKALDFSVLPQGFTRTASALFYAEPVPLKRTIVSVATTKTSIAVAEYQFNTADHAPSRRPSTAPTSQPSGQPASAPSTQPSSSPTADPTVSARPTSQPSTASPTNTHKPSALPTVKPTTAPSVLMTHAPSAKPTLIPTQRPSTAPSAVPTPLPTVKSSLRPTPVPTPVATRAPRTSPSPPPARAPSIPPTAVPSAQPTAQDDGRRSDRSTVIWSSVGGALVLCAGVYAFYMYRVHIAEEDAKAKRKIAYFAHQEMLVAALVKEREEMMAQIRLEDARKEKNRKKKRDTAIAAAVAAGVGAGAYAAGEVRTQSPANPEPRRGLPAALQQSPSPTPLDVSNHSDDSVVLSSLHSSEMDDDEYMQYPESEYDDGDSGSEGG